MRQFLYGREVKKLIQYFGKEEVFLWFTHGTLLWDQLYEFDVAMRCHCRIGKVTRKTVPLIERYNTLNANFSCRQDYIGAANMRLEQ